MNDASFSKIINKSPSNRNKDGTIGIADIISSPDIYEPYERAWADPEGGGRGFRPPHHEKSQKYIVL